MKAETKRYINKIFIITGCCLVVILTALGIYFISHSKKAGTEKILSNESEIQTAMRLETESLSDEEFEYGIQHIMPISSQESSTSLAALDELKNAFEDILNYTPEAQYFDSFDGTNAYFIISTEVNLDEFLPLLETNTFFNKIFILRTNKAQQIKEIYIYTNSLMQLVFSLTDNSSELIEDTPSYLEAMINSVCTEYQIDKNCFVYSNNELFIDTSNVSTSIALCIFDYCWQYCYASDIHLTLIITAGQSLLALADTSKSDFYDSYYPNNELAALFRLEYYYKSFFLFGDLRQVCQVYFIN